MKKWLLFSLFIGFYGLGTAQADNSELIKVGQHVPAFTIVSDNGRQLHSSEWKGKVVMITFFATWCPPCQKELANIQKEIWEKYKDNKNFRLAVIGREHSEAELEEYNRKKGFTFPLYPDKNRKIFSAFARNLIPRTYLVGKDGKILYVMKGYTPEDFAVLKQKLAALL